MAHLIRVSKSDMNFIPSLSLKAICDAFAAEGLQLRYRRRGRYLDHGKFSVSDRDALRALIAHYMAQGDTFEQAEWMAELDRCNKNREWKMACRGELK